MLKDALLAREISEAQLIETGLVVKPEDGGASFDRFRNRLMFPILIRGAGVDCVWRSGVRRRPRQISELPRDRVVP